MQACRLSLYRRIRSTIPWFRTVADPALRSVAFSLMQWPILCRSRRSIACASRSELYVLENSLIRATLDAKARLISLWDKTAEREVLSAAGNIWQTFEDRPLVWDAWDIDPFFEDRQDDMLSPCEVEIVEQGPLRIGPAVYASVWQQPY